MTAQPEPRMTCTRCLRAIPESQTTFITSTTYRGQGRQKRTTIYNTIHRVCVDEAECDAARAASEQDVEAVS